MIFAGAQKGALLRISVKVPASEAAASLHLVQGEALDPDAQGARLPAEVATVAEAFG